MSIQPDIKIPSKLPNLPIELNLFDSGLTLYSINANAELLRISFVFNAGKSLSHNPALAQIVQNLFLSGTKSMSSADLNERLDLLGAYIDTDLHEDYAIVHVYCLTPHLVAALAIIKSVLNDFECKHEELEIEKQRRLQQLEISLGKTSVLARRAFNTHFFPGQKVFRNIDPTSILSIQVEEVQDFFYKNYCSGLNYIVSSGTIEPKLFADFEAFYSPKQNYIEPQNFGNGKRIDVNKENALQSCIILGIPSVPRTHSDYPALSVSNTLLGGYFGSRLMKKVREELGLTYGISSILQTNNFASFQIISTEVKNESREEAIEAIKNEIDRFTCESCSDKEIRTAINYMAGNLLRAFDGKINQADRLITIKTLGLTYDYFQSYLDTILNSDSLTIQRVSQKYFIHDQYLKVLCGNFS
jgi:predicted Zn-dependent peptidase